MESERIAPTASHVWHLREAKLAHNIAERIMINTGLYRETFSRLE